MSIVRGTSEFKNFKVCFNEIVHIILIKGTWDKYILGYYFPMFRLHTPYGEQ